MDNQVMVAASPATLAAFAAVLGDVETVRKSKVADTGKFSYGYASLDDVLGECKEACGKHGLAVTQIPSMTDDHLSVTTILISVESGDTISFPPAMLRMPTDAQSLGSALTYLRRYSLMALFGIAPEDDDGATATRSARTVDATGGYRSEAESKIHTILADLPGESSRQLVKDFREEFGSGLSGLPVGRHGDALTWTRRWIEQPAETLDTAGDES